ncbi:E3 ubiquitin-protein ligase RHF2A-like isoform X2 [Papaver somniferum]|uniref:E3 ubiquitin-protein ligase RHF2A-like isoform X2 n=1 Tax=Papaver somniferum TaxID=3469 RepID=UPI000E70174F|nr:E3 ubiquitin-protein ligase RHF2A-like isoform X2 [Papaver somniferum]
MDETKKTEKYLISPAAFVEGGVQDSCDDACSICLEAFTESDPSTVTTCKHEFHLQCILEWAQRSSQCPMCWQAISLKDATSQELFTATEQERNFQLRPSRNATIFHHPTLHNFDLPHLSVGANDSELEERILQHLAAAAAMGRAHHFARRESQRTSSNQGHSPYMVFSPNSDVGPSGPVSGITSQRRREHERNPLATGVNPSAHLVRNGEEPPQSGSMLPSVRSDQIPGQARSSNLASSRRRTSFSNTSASRSSSINRDRAGPSDFQSFSESLKSRLNSVSMRYKESISKGTRGWKERLFSRSSSIKDLGSEVTREVNTGLASVSRMMERLETRENSRSTDSSELNNLDREDTDVSNQGVGEGHANTTPISDRNTSVSCAARPGPV